MILNLDRFQVISMGAMPGTARLVLLALSRLTLSALLGIVITTPLVLQILWADVGKQLVIMHAKQRLTADNGLLAQVQALSQLTGSDTAIAVTVDVTFLFFFLILMLPVTAKILLNLGPPSAYEQVARYKDEQVIDAARAARIVTRRIEEENTDARLRIEELKAQARFAIEQDMRQKEEDLGMRANEHVARQMEAILDEALQEWSNQVRATLAAPEKGQTQDPGVLPPFRPWPSAPSPQPEARPGYNMPTGGEL